MLLNLTWLIPGLPIIASVLIAVLLVSFSKTMNRLTKPVSFIFITSVLLSEIIDLILFKKEIVGIALLPENFNFLKNNFQLSVDSQALLVSLMIGFIFLLIMIFSLIKLKRRSGYVRYLIFLGFLNGLFYLFSFSGNIFHNLLDPLILALDKSGLTLI